MLTPNTSLASATISAVVAAGTSTAIAALPNLASSDYTIKCQITSLTAVSGVPTAVIAVYDSVDAFTNKVPVALFTVSGTIGGGGIILSRRVSEESPNFRIGVASAVARADVPVLGGTTPSMTYAVWIE